MADPAPALEAAPPAPGVQALMPEPGQVAIRDTDGSVSLIRAEDLPRAMSDEGARPATQDEYLAAKTGKAGEAASAAIGLGRGATLGLLDPAAIEASRALGGDASAEDTRAALNRARAVNPNATLGGELVGSLAPLAIGLPPAAELGEGAGLAARIGAAAPELLGQGAAMGAGQVLSEDALGDHQTTAEKLVAGAAGGAVLNLLLGGALHAGGAGAASLLDRLAAPADDALVRELTTYGAKDIESLAGREFGATEKGLGEKVREHLVNASAAVSGKDASAVDLFTRDAFRPGAEGAEARRIGVFDADKEIEAAQRELRGAGDEMLKATPAVTDEFRGALKADKIGGLVRTDNEADVVAYAKKKIGDVIGTVESELTHADGVAPQTIKSLESISRSAYGALADVDGAIARGGKVNETAFMALDRLKRDVQGLTDGGYRRIAAMTDPYEGRLARRTVDNMNGLQNDLRKGLENSELWGKAGDVQAAINAEWTMQIDASKRFRQALTTEIGRDPKNPFLKQLGIDPAKLDTYSRSLLNPKNDLTHAAVRDYVESTERLAKTIRENVDLPAAKLAEVKRIEASAAKFKATIDKTEKTLTIANQYKHLASTGGDSAAALAGMLGFTAGGPIGGALGTAVGALTSPARTIAQLAALERMAAKVDGKLGGGVRAFLNGRAARKAPATARVTPDQVRQLRALVSSPDALRARVGEIVAPLAKAAPRTAQAVGSTLTRMAMYLARKLPTDDAAPTFGIVKPRPGKFSAQQMVEAQEAVASVDSVDEVVGSLERGTLRRSSIEGLREVYPRLYQKLRSDLQAQAIKLQTDMTDPQLVALSLLFDVPLHPVMQPSNVRAFQQTFATSAPDPTQSPGTAAPSGGGGPTLTRAGGTRGTATDALARGDTP